MRWKDFWKFDLSFGRSAIERAAKPAKYAVGDRDECTNCLAGTLVPRIEEIEHENKLMQIRLARTVDAAYHAMLEITGGLGIPERNREKMIADHMSNVRFCAKNNLREDEK